MTWEIKGTNEVDGIWKKGNKRYYAQCSEKNKPKEKVRLPEDEIVRNVVLKIITKNIYESHRHPRESDLCVAQRRAVTLLRRLDPDYFEGLDTESYESFLKKCEEAENRYFGEELSDDSDEECTIEDPRLKLARAATKTDNFWESALVDGDKALEAKLWDLVLKVVDKKITDRKTIAENLENIRKLYNTKNNRAQLPYEDIGRPVTEEQQQAITRINTLLDGARERTGKLTESEIREIQSLCDKQQFFVLQYRGIHYLQARWNAPSRRYHRNMNEIGSPQFSEMVLKTLPVDLYRGLEKEHDYSINQDLQDELKTTAEKLHQFMEELREKGPCIASTDEAGKTRYYFNNILEFLNHRYSNGILKFLELLENLRKKHPDYWGVHFPNGLNPFVSFANTTYHALKYAFGMKSYYNGLFPIEARYQPDGSIEYPHVGKLYMSIHPAAKLLLEECPNNVTQFDMEGRVRVNGTQIKFEKEMSYLAVNNGSNIAHQLVVRFPSFKKNWKSLSDLQKRYFSVKYGMTPKLYVIFQTLIREFEPHTSIREAALKLLFEHLCCFHEIALTRIAFQSIPKEGQILFFDQKGHLSTTPPTEALLGGAANKESREAVHAQRILREMMGKELKGEDFYGFTIVPEENREEAVNAVDPDVLAKAVGKVAYKDVVVGQLFSSEDAERAKKLFSTYAKPSPTTTPIKTKPSNKTAIDLLEEELENFSFDHDS